MRKQNSDLLSSTVGIEVYKRWLVVTYSFSFKVHRLVRSQNLLIKQRFLLFDFCSKILRLLVLQPLLNNVKNRGLDLLFKLFRFLIHHFKNEICLHLLNFMSFFLFLKDNNTLLFSCYDFLFCLRLSNLLIVHWNSHSCSGIFQRNYQLPHAQNQLALLEMWLFNSRRRPNTALQTEVSLGLIRSFPFRSRDVRIEFWVIDPHCWSPIELIFRFQPRERVKCTSCCEYLLGVRLCLDSRLHFFKYFIGRSFYNVLNNVKHCLLNLLAEGLFVIVKFKLNVPRS